NRILGGENCYLCIRFILLPIYPLDTGRNADAFLAKKAIGETVDDSAPLPVTIRGEDAGRAGEGRRQHTHGFEDQPPTFTPAPPPP
ncbi:hypothetical protein, partial [Mesorhizobium sp. B3-2-1]|uniref:hypothetical protein n=1 Tax=Mesorhizobium sp. B3-2-1 TaxID=2589891 RepID=UPI001AED549E